jgi:Probable cobalt transporter subunit (CbtB)
MVQHPANPNAGQRMSLGDFPLWSWLLAAILLLVLFALLSASSDLLAPVVGHTARAADYLHEFAHDGRHLLGVPCH